MKENRKSNAISRRGLLGAAGVMAAAPVVGRASTIVRPKEKFDAVYDVIVVGSGFAALASALRPEKRAQVFC